MSSSQIAPFDELLCLNLNSPFEFTATRLFLKITKKKHLEQFLQQKYP